MENFYAHISKTLKHLRKERGWSLDRLAQETGVSKAMLGQIEREESSPTIATLWKIATGLDVPFSTFIAKLAKTIHPNEPKIKVLPLFPYDESLKMEIFLIELLPGCEHLSTPHKSGVIEHVIVATGNMEILVDGSWKALRQGEAIRFCADQPHGYRNNSQEIAVIHDIIHY